MDGLDHLLNLIEEIAGEAECDELHKAHGDLENSEDSCRARSCNECWREALRNAADEIKIEMLMMKLETRLLRALREEDKKAVVYLLPGAWCDEFPCFGFHGGEELEVFDDGDAVHVSGSVQCREKEKKVGFRGTCYPQPSHLTHIKPEPPDSWEKWRKEFIKPPCVYCLDILGVDFDNDTELGKAFDAQVQDMERRARALAERGE